MENRSTKYTAISSLVLAAKDKTGRKLNEEF